MLTFGVAGNIHEVAAVVDNLELCSHLANVGDAKTLIIHLWRTTHQPIPDQEKIRGGITPNMIRVKLGLEHIDDIIHDFEQAFAGAGLKPAKGWTPTWKTGMTDKMWNEGTLYAPNPNGKVSGIKEEGERKANGVEKINGEEKVNGGKKAAAPATEHPTNGTQDAGKRKRWLPVYK